MLHTIYRVFSRAVRNAAIGEKQKILIAQYLIENNMRKREISSLKEVEFSVFSQCGDDGIIQWLVSNLEIPNETFIEFGVGDYRESTTRFLLMHDNWSGLVLDKSAANIRKIKRSEYYWRYELDAKAVFVQMENINEILHPEAEQEVGLLHIDIDGNDYWVWKAITVISPVIAVVEYNSVFGLERPITIPYSKNFYRTKAHHSNLYYGASLKALHQLAASKGYAFIGCNSAGNNAYFVKREYLNETVREQSLEQGYVKSKFRESRNKYGRLSYLTGEERSRAIRGLPVYNVESEKMESY